MKNSKKILIVSYYWPPAGGPGVQRWLKFAKYLPEFNWEPIIYTPENPSYPLLDESLNKEVSKELKVVKTKIWEPYQLAEKLSGSNKKFKAGQFDVGENQSWKSKLSIWVRGNLFIPDARVFWVTPSIKFLKKYIAEHGINTLITTGPPHSMHLIGLGLKEENPNLKWIADFRDPWTEISYYKHLKLTTWADEKHKKLERKILQTADITLATSFIDAQNFRGKGANAICITNGYDEEAQNQTEVTNHKFTLSYIGVLEQLRNPQNLWEVLESLVTENSDLKSDLEIRFVGKIDDKIQNQLAVLSLNENIKNLGYLPHDLALKEMQTSDVLLITNFPEEKSKGIIPGKLFEYLATRKQIISFGVKGSDVEKILSDTKAGQHFDYQEKNAIKAYILQVYQAWKEGKNTVSSQNIEQFSRKNLTKQLVEIL